jgi:ABC-type sugar transport system permease subunit
MTTTAIHPRSTASEKAARSSRGGLRAVPALAWWIVSILLAAGFIYPVVVMIGMALKGPVEQGAIPPTLLPRNPTLSNFAHLTSVQGLNVFQNLANSVEVTLATTVGTVIVSTLAGYALARAPFPGRNVVFIAILATFMIPFQAVITPLFMVLRTLGLNNSLVGLTLVYITFNLPFGLFIMRNAFAAIPASLEEAALIDVLRLVERVLRGARPHHGSEQVHSSGDADARDQRPVRQHQLGSIAGGRRFDGDPVHPRVRPVAAVLRQRVAQRSPEVTLAALGMNPSHTDAL